jgi:hypothetical protein
MTFEEFAATRMPGLLRFAAVLAGDRATAEDLAMGGRFSETNAEDRPHSLRQLQPVAALLTTFSETTGRIGPGSLGLGPDSVRQDSSQAVRA